MRLAMSNSLSKTFPLSTLSNYLGSRADKFGIFTNLLKGNLKPLTPAHFTLEQGEVFRMPTGYQELYVLSGTAWISVNGQDIILLSGDKVSLETNKGSALISALGESSLSLEVL